MTRTTSKTLLNLLELNPSAGRPPTDHAVIKSKHRNNWNQMTHAGQGHIPSEFKDRIKKLSDGGSIKLSDGLRAKRVGDAVYLNSPGTKTKKRVSWIKFDEEKSINYKYNIKENSFKETIMSKDVNEIDMSKVSASKNVEDKRGEKASIGLKIKAITRGWLRSKRTPVAKQERTGNPRQLAIKKPIEEALRLKKTYEHNGRKAKIYKDHEWEEHRVKFYTHGKHHKDADYHTDDEEDAHDTAKHWLSKMRNESKKPLRSIIDKG